MPRTCNDTTLEKLKNTTASFVGYLDPSDTSSKRLLKLACRCGTDLVYKRNYIFSRLMQGKDISCGCVDKKWTNANIDRALSTRSISRLTDCDVKGFQPSCMKVALHCETCNYQWAAVLDSVINKKSGCPACAGNIPYTVESLQHRLNEHHRRDLEVLSITPGRHRTENSPKLSPYGTFRCTSCDHIWSADIHNVLKFRYGCPICNSNVSTPVVTMDGRFGSKLEYYFWTKASEQLRQTVTIERQVRYLPTRRLTCDFVLSEKNMWIEISGKSLLNQERYKQTIETKREICANEKRQFFCLTSFAEIDNFIDNLKETI
jgi:hypothetical protein